MILQISWYLDKNILEFKYDGMMYNNETAYHSNLNSWQSFSTNIGYFRISKFKIDVKKERWQYPIHGD